MSWQKTNRIKARVSKKLAGVKEKQKAALKSVSGSRTKKHQRKVDRRKRLDSKETAALEAAMDVEAVAPAAKKIKKNKGNKTGGVAPMQD